MPPETIWRVNAGSERGQFFFIKVDSICHRPAITCPPEMALVEMAHHEEDDISGIIVDDEKPVGRFSARPANLIADGATGLRA
jgi:hypothetical protein